MAALRENSLKGVRCVSQMTGLIKGAVLLLVGLHAPSNEYRLMVVGCCAPSVCRIWPTSRQAVHNTHLGTSVHAAHSRCWGAISWLRVLPRRNAADWMQLCTASAPPLLQPLNASNDECTQQYGAGLCPLPPLRSRWWAGVTGKFGAPSVS